MTCSPIKTIKSSLEAKINNILCAPLHQIQNNSFEPNEKDYLTAKSLKAPEKSMIMPLSQTLRAE